MRRLGLASNVAADADRLEALLMRTFDLPGDASTLTGIFFAIGCAYHWQIKMNLAFPAIFFEWTWKTGSRYTARLKTALPSV
jgi:hypothetical protein